MPRQPLPWAATRNPTAATEVAELFAPAPPELEAYRPRLAYQLIDEARLKLHPAESVRGVVEALFRLEHGRAPEDFLRVVRALDALLREPALAGLRRSFNVWIKRLLRRRVAAPTLGDIEQIKDLLEPNAMIEERIDAWFEEATRKGRVEGRMEGEARLLARLLERRFGALPPAVRERLTGASETQLETWGEALLSAPSLDAVFA